MKNMILSFIKFLKVFKTMVTIFNVSMLNQVSNFMHYRYINADAKESFADLEKKEKECFAADLSFPDYLVKYNAALNAPNQTLDEGICWLGTNQSPASSMDDNFSAFKSVSVPLGIINRLHNQTQGIMPNPIDAIATLQFQLNSENVPSKITKLEKGKIYRIPSAINIPLFLKPDVDYGLFPVTSKSHDRGGGSFKTEEIKDRSLCIFKPAVKLEVSLTFTSLYNETKKEYKFELSDKVFTKNYEDITVVPIFSFLPIKLFDTFQSAEVQLFLCLNIGPVLFDSKFDLSINIKDVAGAKRKIEIKDCGIGSIPNNRDFYKFDDAKKINSKNMPSRKITMKQILGWVFLIGWAVLLFAMISYIGRKN